METEENWNQNTLYIFETSLILFFKQSRKRVCIVYVCVYLFIVHYPHVNFIDNGT